MTARQVYEGVLIEMNKVNAPSLLLEDFNYLFNKAINLYINKRYNIYDVNQLTSDDVRVLKATAIIPAVKSNVYGNQYRKDVTAMRSLYGATYEVNLPLDYLHILNCVCNYKVTKQFKCYDADTYVLFGAYRLTADAWSNIINNFYMKPSYKKPYYYIHNVNKNDQVPTNSYEPLPLTETGFGAGTDILLHVSLRQRFDAFLKDNNLVCTEQTSASDLTVNGTTAEISEVTYYVTTKDGVLYCVVYDVANDRFELIEDAFTSIYCQTSVIYVFTTNEDITVRNKSLYINSNPTTSKYILVTSGLLNKYANSWFGDGLPREIVTKYGNIDLVEKNGVHRYGNASNIRMEIRYGKDDSIFELESVYIDYIKTPQHIRLTLEQLDLTEDTSQIMEFPDYVCQEIINELVHISMENASDPRLQSHPVVTQSIANPAQGLTQTAQGA